MYFNCDYFAQYPWLWGYVFSIVAWIAQAAMLICIAYWLDNLSILDSNKEIWPEFVFHLTGAM